MGGIFISRASERVGLRDVFGVLAVVFSVCVSQEDMTLLDAEGSSHCCITKPIDDNVCSTSYTNLTFNTSPIQFHPSQSEAERN